MPNLAVSPEVSLAYEILGEGPPIVLVHGFASSRSMNWRTPGWYDTLVGVGRQVIAVDMRGHGESSKPHDAAAYDEGEMAGDIVRLVHHLGHRTVDLMGYSMGGFISLRLLHDAPRHFRRVVIAGVGENYYGRGPIETDAIAAGLRAPSLADVTGAVPRMFRQFAEQGRNDLEALALCMTRKRVSFPRFAAGIPPVLVVVGERDNITGPADVLVEALPGAQLVVVPGRDHMTTVGDRAYKNAVVSFLSADA